MTLLLQISVLLMTILVIVVNYYSATGAINNRDAGDVSAVYPTGITPAGYAFTIWSLIYLGTIAFSFYQLVGGPDNKSFISRIRIPYLILCAANIGWIFSWHYELIPLAMAFIIVMLLSLAKINVDLKDVGELRDLWLLCAPFSIYFGWVTLATILNAAILFRYWGLTLDPMIESLAGTLIVFAAAMIGIVLRFRLRSIGYPLAIAWGLTAIGVEQSGNTLVVTATALGMMALVFFALWGFVKDR